MGPTSKPSIRPVLEHYGWDGRVTGYGAWRNTRCPIHKDRNPSARVNEEEQVFHCNACGVSGDAYSVVQAAEGVDFATAKQRVQEITGASYNQVSGGAGKRLTSSKLPAWTRNRDGARPRLSSRSSRRQHS